MTLISDTDAMGVDHQAYNRACQQALYNPINALETIQQARAALDALERTAVIRARRNKKTWARIGLALGMSRQAAIKRHPGVE